EAHNFIRTLGKGDAAAAATTVEKLIKETTTRELDLSGLPESLIAAFRPTYELPKNETVISYLDAGRRKFVKLDPELYRAWLHMDNEPRTFLTRLLQGPATLLRAGAVLSPEFQVRNPIRDLGTALVNTAFSPVDSLRGFFHLLRRDDVYKEFKATG